MKIYICDDEPKILSDISSKVKSELADAVVSEFAGGKLLLKQKNILKQQKKIFNLLLRYIILLITAVSIFRKEVPI